MKKLFSLLVIAYALHAQTQVYQQYGVSGSGGPIVGSGSFAMNAAANWYGAGFQLQAAKTVLKARVYVAAVNGTMGASDFKCSIQADTGLTPSGTDIDSTTTLTAPIAGTAWAECTTFAGVALSAYTPYRVVFKNLNGTPATNYPTLRYLTGFGAGSISGPASGVVTTTNSGSTWTQQASESTPIYRLEFSDGSFQGYPVEFSASVAGGISTNHRVRSTVQSGVVFTTPAGLSWSVAGCAMPVAKIGAPTGNLTCNIALDNGSTVAIVSGGTSANSYAAAGVDTTSRRAGFYFATPITLAPSTKYRVYLAESAQSDSTSNYFGANAWTMTNDANSLSLLPMQGTWRGTYCAATCGTSANWPDDGVNLPDFALLLTPAGEATSSGGSGGTRVYAH